MVKKMCDRCGKDIPIVGPITAATNNGDYYPSFMINVRVNSWSSIRSIDLCHECSVAVFDFIRSAPAEEVVTEGEIEVNGVV